jgi:hypothetical protein
VEVEAGLHWWAGQAEREAASGKAARAAGGCEPVEGVGVPALTCAAKPGPCLGAAAWKQTWIYM